MPKLCERCRTSKATSGERYCRSCRKAVLAELQEAGYLTSRQYGHVGSNRPQEAKEATYETKHGTWQR